MTFTIGQQQAEDLPPQHITRPTAARELYPLSTDPHRSGELDEPAVQSVLSGMRSFDGSVVEYLTEQLRRQQQG